MEALDARLTYQVVAALFQILLAPLIASTRSRPAIRVALPLILVLNAAEALREPLERAGVLRRGTSGIASMDVALLADPVIVITLAFVLSQLPTPLGGARGARIAAAVWGGWSFAWVILVLAVGASTGDPERAQPYTVFAQLGGFVAAGFVLATHVVPRWLALAPGPLRGQTLLLAGGTSIGLGVVAASNLRDLPTTSTLMLARAVVLAGMGAFLVAAMALLARDALLHRRKDASAFLALVAIGPLIGLMSGVRGFNTNEFASQTLRPVLFAAAVLRYDLVDVPLRLRAIVFPATGVVLAVSAFFGLHAIVTRQNVALTPMGATVSVALLSVGAILLRKPVGDALRASGGEAGNAGRVERYRLALESSGPPYASRELDDLKRRLRVTDDEHDTLVAILRSHVVVPTRAVRGLQPGDRVADRYEVVRELGRGGQGRALLARDAGSGALVALKEIARPWEHGADERLAALRREAEAGARVDSPLVARTIGIVEDAGISYLAREFVPGETLEALVAKLGPLPEPRACSIAKDVLDGLAAIHAAGLLHLDLKPSNVVLGEHGRAVVIDLGTARHEARAGEGTLTQGAAPGGTLGWMAPEQAAGARVGRAADVYGAGALFAFLLTGRKPTSSNPNPLVAGALARVVRRACASEPSARYASAAEMRDALDAR